MNKKVLVGIPLVALMTLFAVLLVAGAGTKTPTCYFTDAGSTNASLESENTTIIFGITTNINMTNVTFALSPGPNGNTSIYYDSTGSSSNLTSPIFQIENVPDGHYTITATSKFMNYTATGPYVQEHWNLTAMSATCTAYWTIDSSEGGLTRERIVASSEAVSKTDPLIILMIVVILVIVLVNSSSKKK